MKRLRRGFCFAILASLLIANLAFGQDEPSNGKDKKPLYADPPKLELAFSDDFSTDTRGNYEIDGDIEWKKGELILRDGASISRELDAQEWVEIELELEFAELTEDGQESELKILLDLEPATDSFVLLRRKRHAEAVHSDIRLFDTPAKQENSGAKPTAVRSIEFKTRLPDGVWQIGYRNGVWSVRSPVEAHQLFGHIENGVVSVGQLRITQNGAPVQVAGIEFKQFGVVASDFSPDQVKELDRATELRRQVSLLDRQGRSDKAFPLALQALDIHRQILGSFHLKTAKSLYNLARQYNAKGDYARAEPLYLEAKGIREKVLGKEHPSYADILHYLAGLYGSMGDYARAVPLHLEAKTIYEKVLGREHPSYAHSLNNLAGLYGSMGDYARAEPLYLESKTIYEKVLGREHPSYAHSLNNLAALFGSMGDYARAVPLLVEAKAIYEKVLGREHPSYADILHNLAVLYGVMGDYARAEPLYLEAKAIQEKVLGREHPSYARSLHNLAVLYTEMGDCARAEPLYLEAKGIREKVLGKENPSYADSLHKLAVLYTEMGDYARAEPLYLEAKGIREKVLGKEHPSYADSLDKLAGLYGSMGDYARAEPLHLEAKTILEKVLGREHPSYADSLHKLAGLYGSMGDYARAEPLYLEAKGIREKVLGRKHHSYADSLDNLAVLYFSMGDYARAEPLYLEAKAIQEKVLGREHPSYANSLNSLAGLYGSMGDYARAEPLLVEAKANLEKVLGREHPSYARSLDNLANVYHLTEDYARAEPLRLEAKTIYEKVLGREHPSYARSLRNLAALYTEMGDYARAEPLLVEAKAILEKVLGREHPSYANSLVSLALLYTHMGDYARAEPLNLEAKTIYEKVLRKEHPDYATLLDNLALLYTHMGDYARAEPLYLEAKAIYEKMLGREHPSYAGSLYNLAVLYFSMGDYARAEPLHLEAKAILEKVLGREHPSYANSLGSLAVLYFSMGDYARAEPLHLEAKAIYEKVLGREHRSYATSLSGLAFLYADQGNYARAEPLILEAKTIYEKVLGREHPSYAGSLNNLAKLYTEMGDYARAEPLYLEAVSINERFLDKSSVIQSEQQQLAMANSTRNQLMNCLAFVVESGSSTETVFQYAVQLKGRTTTRQLWIRMARLTENPKLQRLFGELQSIAARLSKLSSAIPEKNQRDIWRRQLDELSVQRDVLDRKLSAASADYRATKTRSRVGLEQLLKSLPQDAALVDIHKYNRKLEKTNQYGVSEREAGYCAFVVRRGMPIKLVELGSVAEIEKWVGAWRSGFGAADVQGNDPGNQLRKLLWDPIAPLLNGVKTILISPEGTTALIPWGVLPGSEPGSYLIEERAFGVIPVPQMLPKLVDARGAKSSASGLLLAVGGVEYQADKPSKSTSDGRANQLLSQITVVSKDPTDTTRGGAWRELFDTSGEIDSIENRFAELMADQPQFDRSMIVRLDGSEATETEFVRHAPNHRFLHVATHGFFAPESVKNAARIESDDSVHRMMVSLVESRKSVQGFPPGMLSGLVFAGASSPERESNDDGYLFAEEIAFLPLENVDMVVLSACETGLGEVAGGEGLLGMQRAFQVSGARTTVASLWEVPSAATRTIMEQFYANYLQKGMSKIEALRQAQLYVLNNPDAVRGLDVDSSNDGKSMRSHPRFWAAWVLSGDWQ